ncbi:MAG: hypothetical protein PHX44_01650 [Sulfurimonas sp.]|uniref:hypothetical protein n=1 Tax=Sulfurimonas sp. TaxID=2022749 RepID=UPI0026341F28|nr:hypothetical protein [Sulfurimonas sp.]MDD2651722.1 hypothetical protein [Sulfurimonas sp.]MDD2651739.1 hypothetical protein [Sulfurimonas sp.]MDD3451709.1 hypothetical protein [Sulfurimonas sp.]MDD3451726.1 hypothetical protein [Sulfurimonas sp.]
MSKSLVINRFSGKNHSITLPCDDTVAATFASAVLDGEFAVYSLATTSGASDVETSYKDMQIMVKNSTTAEKTYLNIKVKANKSEEDVFAVLIGMTINGVVVDEAFVISNRLITA